MWERTVEASLAERSSRRGVDVKLFGRQLWVTNVKLPRLLRSWRVWSKLPDQDEHFYRSSPISDLNITANMCIISLGTIWIS